MGLMPENWLSEFALFITEVFMHRDQLSHLEALLSRATSYMGEKLPLAVYLKVASNVRRRCHLILRHNEMTRVSLSLFMFALVNAHYRRIPAFSKNWPFDVFYALSFVIAGQNTAYHDTHRFHISMS